MKLSHDERALLLRFQCKAVWQAYQPPDKDTDAGLAASVQALQLAEFALRWTETGEASFIDSAVQYCDDNDLPIKNELRFFVAQAARTRNPIDQTKATREIRKKQAFEKMLVILFHGTTVAEAAGKAAAYSSDQGYPIKASTLERQYSAVYRTGHPTKESVIFEIWNEVTSDEERQEQFEEVQQMRPPTDDEIGNRRF